MKTLSTEKFSFFLYMSLKMSNYTDVPRKVFSESRLKVDTAVIQISYHKMCTRRARFGTAHVQKSRLSTFQIQTSELPG